MAVVECPHTLRSFTGLRGLTAAECTRVVARDLEELARFYRCFYGAGGRFVFRTAVNAETLYALRRQLEAIKISDISLNGRRVTLVRDQHQGFYACDSWHDRDGAIDFQGSFHKVKLRRIHDYAAAKLLPGWDRTPRLGSSISTIYSPTTSSAGSRRFARGPWFCSLGWPLRN